MKNSVPPFHLAFPVADLAETRAFYRDLLGCAEGRSADRWVDFDFFGHQISAHLSDNAGSIATHNQVEDKSIPVPHFGVILTLDQFSVLEDRLRLGDATFHLEPFTRFPGKAGEQRTMFIRDPSGNMLEFKAFADRDQIYKRDLTT